MLRYSLFKARHRIFPYRGGNVEASAGWKFRPTPRPGTAPHDPPIAHLSSTSLLMHHSERFPERPCRSAAY
jgi:hypothetical protein